MYTKKELFKSILHIDTLAKDLVQMKNDTECQLVFRNTDPKNSINEYSAEVVSRSGNAVEVSSDGSALRVYKDGNVYSSTKTSTGTAVTKELGVPTQQLIISLLESDDLVKEIKTGSPSEQYFCYTTHKIPTIDKEFSNYIANNFPDFSNIQVRLYSDNISIWIGNTKPYTTPNGSGVNICCIAIQNQTGVTGFQLDSKWDILSDNTPVDTVTDLLSVEQNKAHTIIKQQAHKVYAKYCQQLQGVTYNDWGNAIEEQKAEYIDKLDGSFTSDVDIRLWGSPNDYTASKVRSRLITQVDNYYKNYNTQDSLAGVLEYIIYTGGVCGNAAT